MVSIIGVSFGVITIFLSDYFGYVAVENILIWGGIFLLFIIICFASLHIFKKEGDSKRMLILRALILPIGWIVLVGFFGIFALLNK